MGDAAPAKPYSERNAETVRARRIALPPLIRAMRPLQWSKNSLVFAALLFDKRVFQWDALWHTLAAAMVFSAVSSAIYLVNDVRDVEQDRLHPKKRFRPIASGEVSPGQAMRVAVALLTVGLITAVAVRPEFAIVIVAYIALMLAYSYGLKRMVILDVFAIAAGFVLRAVGGAVAIDVPASPWLYVCTALGALFIGFGKRRNEIVTLEAAAGQHRANLEDYNLPMLDQIIAIVSAAMLIAYSLYTFDAANVPSSHAMMLTIPYVAYGLFRYLYLIYRRGEGGSPEVLLIKDPGLISCIVGWVATSLIILYLS
ncbi:MAG TPA: decaprenyl-phosphate phosphoribosyltransferase [Thermomicrobiales bacterium]|nr:decaprenyl-phosphate phosphoribosyltransferase [Thermomicrobiales bacterium]